MPGDATGGGGFVSARLALRWLIIGEWRAHPVRIALTAVAIAIGVALGFAVHLVNGSALGAFDGALKSVNGAADLHVRATSPLGFDEMLYPKLARAPGVADASPVIFLSARAGAVRFSLLGIDVLRAAQVTPSLVGMPARGLDRAAETVFAADSLFASPGLLRALKARPGDSLDVTAAGHVARFRISGALPGVGDERPMAVIDIAAAQWHFGRLGRLDRIDIKRAANGDDRAIAALLPRDAVIDTAADASERGDALSRAYRVNLDMLALVALLTGGFLVFSAQSLSVARRLRAFALVRTLGLPRAAVVATVAIEGLLIGLVGALLGLGLGYALAYGALVSLGGDLGAGYFRDGSVSLRFDPIAACGFFSLGVAVAVLGSALPARLAARAAPAVALRNAGDVIDPRAAVAWLPAAVLIALGGGVALLPPIGALPIGGYLGMALILAGGIAAMPWLARTLLRPLARRPSGPVPIDLAIRHLHGAPVQAATALCGIVASTALMIAMAVMVTSFRGAVDGWLGQILSADLYLRSDGGGFDRAAQARLAATPGVARIVFSRQLPLTLAADRPPVWLIVRPMALTGGNPALVLIDHAARLPTGRIPVWVSEPAARLYKWSVGDAVSLPIAGTGQGAFVVAGIWRDYARQQGAIILADRDYRRLTGDAVRSEAAVMLRPGADAARVGRALVAAVPEGVRQTIDVARPAMLRRFALTLFDRSFAVTYLLEGVAILVGLAGVAATISAQTLARSRDFGMLRHIGVSRGQLIAMLASEGALLGALGAVAGIALGGVLAEVLVHVVNPQSFNWTMETIVPWGSLGLIALALIAAASGTAVLAGRQALSASAVRMVREDW
ncbi:MAG: ABC transporter permease [Sphingomonas sp. 28-66-16]|nr:MAG: ABC transporter permease [Sphingomonas sp. 28-66-16]